MGQERYIIVNMKDKQTEPVIKECIREIMNSTGSSAWGTPSTPYFLLKVNGKKYDDLMEMVKAWNKYGVLIMNPIERIIETHSDIFKLTILRRKLQKEYGQI